MYGETLLQGRYAASAWVSRREREKERARGRRVTAVRGKETWRVWESRRWGWGRGRVEGRERKREATCYGNGNGSLSAGLSSKRAINDACTPWPHHDRGIARHKASSRRGTCSVVKRFHLTTAESPLYSSVSFAFFLPFVLLLLEHAHREMVPANKGSGCPKICSLRKGSADHQVS